MTLIGSAAQLNGYGFSTAHILYRFPDFGFFLQAHV
ncbi:hypothetical protein [Rhizobium sp. 768_B6_N1_8]